MFDACDWWDVLVFSDVNALVVGVRLVLIVDVGRIAEDNGFPISFWLVAPLAAQIFSLVAVGCCKSEVPRTQSPLVSCCFEELTDCGLVQC